MSIAMRTKPSPKLSVTKRKDAPSDPLDMLGGSDSLVRSKRKPKLMIGGISVLVAGALIGALTMSRGGEQRTAIVAATNIGVGEVITPAMLRVVRIARDTELRTLPGGAASQLIDGVAAVPIAAGSAVLPDNVNRTQTAPEGTVLIGAVLEAGALPSPDLRFGDKVRVLIAPANGGADNPPRVVTEAVVWRIWGTTTGGSRRAITLAVPDAAQVDVGTAAAQNSMRLLLVPNEHAKDAPGWPKTLTTPVIITDNGVTDNGVTDNGVTGAAQALANDPVVKQ
jgi:SAF domain